MKKYFLVFIFVILGYAVAFSEVIRDDKFLSEYVSKTWTSSDGLPGNSITDVIQTSDAYVYIGCYDGLVRFDGVEFDVKNRNTNPNYDFISVRSLFEDSQHQLWIGANDEGLSVVNKYGSVKKITSKDGLPNNSIRSICEDKNGIIWIGTASGIACIQDYKVIELPGWNTIPNDNKIIVKQIFCDSAGRIWITTSDDSGVYIYADRVFSQYNKLKSFDSKKITYVTQDSSNNFWFGVSPYYIVKVENREEIVYNISFSEVKSTGISCIFQDSAKNMWFSTDRGVSVLHGNKISYMNQLTGLSDEKIAKITEDRDGNIWIATDRGGIEKLSRTKFKTTSMMTSVNAIAQDLYRDVVWIGGDNGLYCYKDEGFIENEITDFLQNERIRSILTTKNGDLYVNTYINHGLVKFDKDGNITSYTKENKYLTGNKTRVSLVASDGDLYIGTTNGLSIIDAQTGKVDFITTANGITNDYIMCLYEAKNKDIWVGTDGGGIFILRDKKIVKVYDSYEGLAGNVIFKIDDLNQKDEIWICTGTGISRYKDDKFFNFNYSNGLGIDSVFQMIVDYTMKVWCTSNRGIFSVKLEDLENVADGKREFVNSKYFGYSDGIISSGVTATSLCMKDDNGQIWFTLADGFAVYNPVKGSENNQPPVVHIQEVAVDNLKYTDIKKPIVVSPREKRVSIKYTGISFITSEQVLFSNKLEGFDNTFNEWNVSRSVSYTNLKPGTYKFYLYAMNSNEVVSNPIAPIVIIKKPAYWQTIWFWIVVVVFSLLLLFLLIHSKLTKVRKESNRIHKVSLEITQALAGTIDAKDRYTKGHSSRVAKYSVLLAEKMGKSSQIIENIYMTAMLHDIGKIGIPDSIINKPAKLTEEEYAVIKAHPKIGCEILDSIKTVPDIGIGARWHHERWDGKGYPDQLSGMDIPETARIIAVADAYDAMTSNRSYRKYLDQKTVRAEILKCSGSQFDPDIAGKMIELIDEDINYEMHE